MSIIRGISVIFVGFAGGLAVGSGFVAFLAVLGVIPRVMQLIKENRNMTGIENATIVGALFGCIASLYHFHFTMPNLIIVATGLFSGVFVGMLAAALTEVLNVWPIMAKRIGIQEKILYLLMALAFGKVFGSLFQWIYYVQP